MNAEVINGWCRHNVPFTSCRECSPPPQTCTCEWPTTCADCEPPSSVTEALEDALEREPQGPTKYRCPNPACQREHTETQWQCLQWLQFAGAVRSGRLMVSVEVRRCVCSLPVARECVLPMVEVLP